MMTTRVTVAGIVATSFVLHVPPVGPWWADAVLDGNPRLEGRVDVVLSETLTLRGTVVGTSTSEFGSQVSTRIVAGAASWATLLPARGYHSDSGVSARTVAADAATAAGETLGDFRPGAPTVGIDYVRASGQAATALEAAIMGAAWWVAYDGTTVVGRRSTSTPASGSYQLLEFDPVNRIAVIEANDLGAIVVGSVLAAEERLPTAQTVRELRLEVTAESSRIVAWCGDLDAERGRLARALEVVVRRILSERVYGAVRYRVMRTSGDRAELQAISDGFPNIGPISYAPGIGGAHAELAEGAEVLVEFIEGDPSKPRITHFAGKDGTGWTPISLTFDAQSLLTLGQNATQFVALAEDTKARLDALQNAHDTHSHATAPNGPVSIPSVIVGPLAPIAATKVKAE